MDPNAGPYLHPPRALFLDPLLPSLLPVPTATLGSVVLPTSSVPAPRFPRAGGPPLLPEGLPAAVRPALPGLPRPHFG